MLRVRVTSPKVDLANVAAVTESLGCVRVLGIPEVFCKCYGLFYSLDLVSH